jgi:hypothetical protein
MVLQLDIGTGDCGPGFVDNQTSQPAWLLAVCNYSANHVVSSFVLIPEPDLTLIRFISGLN